MHDSLNSVEELYRLGCKEKSYKAQIATKGNLEKVVTTYEGVFESNRAGFPSRAKKEWSLSPDAKVRVLHTVQLYVTVSS
ncbi:hypothetical protein Tco_1225331 [Tanacetum coccineum]